MNDNTKNKINEELKKLFDSTSFDAYAYEGHEDAESLIESLREQINQDEIIYYANAMKYLMENDCSLHDSLAIASEMGYEADKLSSEILATILYQNNLNEELGGIISDIEEIFDNAEEEEEEEETEE